MAPFEDVVVSRKRITTYGKSVRRRIPEYDFGTTSNPPEKKRVGSHSPKSPSTSPPSPKKLKSVSRPTLYKSLASASPSKANVFDVPSDNEARPLPTVKKPAKTQTVPITEPKKAKVISRASYPKTTSAAAGKSSVFDVPSDGEARPVQLVKKPIKTQSILPAEPKKVKAISRASTPKATTASTSRFKIFDVISSDDEVPLKSRPVAAKITKPLRTTIPKTTEPKQISVAEPDLDRRKRMKFSPVPVSQKPKAAKSPRPITKESRHIAKMTQKSILAGTTSTIVTRPKNEAAPLRREEQRTPRKSSTDVKSTGFGTPSPPFSPIPDRMDIDSPRKYISPKGAQMWKELLNSGENDAEDDIVMNEGVAQAIPTPLLFSNMSHKPVGVTKKLAKPAPKQFPRRRLIDSLVEQATHQVDSDDEMEEDDGNVAESNTASDAAVDSGLSASQNELLSQRIAPEDSAVPTLSASLSTQNSGPKFTYSRQRSMLAEEDLMKQLALDMPTQQPAQVANGRRPRRGSLPVLPHLPSFHDDDVGDDGPTKSVRSVHELRQAGANTRFLDEIEDLLDRIGKPTTPPSSMRRSGLLELASRLQDKNFVRHFGSNGVEQRLLTHLGQEKDAIAGYLMITALMAVLQDVITPHIVAHLRRQGITRLLIRMIEFGGSIVSLSKDRKSNLSKVAQSLILEQNTFILELPIWDDLKPRALSPKTAALKCLEMMVRKTRESGNPADIISKELTTNLFSILESASEEDSWNLPEGKEAIDFFLALSTLESHSIVARTVQDESLWIDNYLPIIAKALEIALNRPTNESQIQGLILRLTLNVTNKNSKASDVFARASLIASMGQIIVVKFKQILGFLTEDELAIALDYLVLVIGVMINFAEWSPLARDTLQSLEGRDNDPLDSIVRLFVDNKKRASEAESLEESSKNVAFGYLSAMLGYLSFSPSIYARIANQQPRKTLRPLVESIEEFRDFHKQVDLSADMEDGHNAEREMTKRLENLVTKLKTPNATL